jgi:hypothetical protein
LCGLAGLVAQNVVLAVKKIDADKRGEGRLKVGVDIPTTGGADSAFSWVVHNRLAFLSAPKTFRMKRSAPCWIISILRDSLSSRRSILRLTYEQGLRSGDRKTSVATYLLGAREAGLSWPLRRIG